MGPHSRVLVVDDEPAIRALIAKIVQRAGFVVDTARDGAEAIEKLDGGDYSVLVIDLMMPNIDGYDVIDHVRASNWQLSTEDRQEIDRLLGSSGPTA